MTDPLTPPAAIGVAAAPASMREATTRGFVYTAGRTFINRGLSMVSFLILGRLLNPADYGVAALANVFISLLAILAAAGYSQTLVQMPEVEDEDLHTIFWIALLTSVLLALAMSVGAVLLADAYDEPQLKPVLWVLSLTFIFIGVGSTSSAVLQRRLDFKNIARAPVIANVVATVVGVAFAFLGFGVWALVVQTVLASGVNSTLIIRASGYRPRFYVSRERFRPMFTQSRNYMGASLLQFTNLRTADFLIGSGLGAVALGVYAVAFRILQVMIEVLSTSVRQVAFPVFARLQGDRERLLRGYMTAMRTCAVVSTPVFLFAVAAAPEMVRIAFGSKWDAAIPIMRILCVFGALQTIVQFNGAVMQSLGQAKLLFRIGLLNTLLQIAACAVAINFGLEWVAVAFVARAYAITPVGLIIVARALDTTARHTLSGIVRPGICSLLMVGVLFALRIPLERAMGPVPRLGVLIVAGAGTYLLLLRVLARTEMTETLSYLTDVLRRRGGTKVVPA